MALLNGPGELGSLDYRSRQEYWLKQISAGVNAGGGGGSGTGGTGTGGGTVATPIASVSRLVLVAANVKISATPQVVAANASRLKVRITNNAGVVPSGGGISNPYGSSPDSEPCYVVVGYAGGGSVTLESWDQIAGPGKSIELDAPALGFTIATISLTPGTIAGGVIVTSYLA